MSTIDVRDASRPEPDRVLMQVADYVLTYRGWQARSEGGATQLVNDR